MPRRNSFLIAVRRATLTIEILVACGPRTSVYKRARALERIRLVTYEHFSGREIRGLNHGEQTGARYAFKAVVSLTSDELLPFTAPRTRASRRLFG